MSYLDPLCRFVVIVALLGLVGCGTRPTTTVQPPDGISPELQERYDDAVAALDGERWGEAEGHLETLASQAKGTDLHPFVRFQQARLATHRDSLRGSKQFLRLAKEFAGKPLGRQARLAGGIAAVDARQCIDAEKALRPSIAQADGAPSAMRALARCRKGLEALALLDRAARMDDDGVDADRAAAADIAKTLDLKVAADAVRRFGSGPLSEPLRSRLATLARAVDDRTLLALALDGMSPDNPDAADAKASIRRARLGVVLPLSGRSRPLGRDLNALVEALFASGEDRPEQMPDLVIVDGGDAKRASAAITALTDAGVFAAVGVFDSTTAGPAARGAAAAGLPLVMLTVSDAPVSVDGPVWRALHTPALVVRTAAGAGLGAGGKVAAVARASDGYGETHARLFAQAWQAGGGKVIGEIAWNPKKPDYAAVAKQLAGARFDTLFVPTDPTGAAQLMRHLAAAGIWARGASARFAGEKGVREVTVIGTPSWYRPSLPRLGGRYVHGVRIPVPFARETARGHGFAERVTAAVNRDATAFDALLVDGIEALQRAWTRHLESGDAPADAIRASGNADAGAAAGLVFSGRDALPALFLMEVTADGFVPAGSKGGASDGG